MSPTLEAGQRPRMDPRIARRRLEVRREEGRRRLRILVWCAVAAAVVLLAVGSLWTPLFQVRHVAVSISGSTSPPAGTPSLTDRDVAAVAGFTHRRLMIDVDGAKVARRLDALPLLGSARVSVDWPGSVKISVTERLPVAAVAVPAGQGSAPRWALVDATGRVLAVDPSPPPGLPVLYGIAVVPQAGGWIPGSAGPSAPVPAGAVSASRGRAAAAASRPFVDMGAASDSPDVPSGVAAALAVAAALPPQIRGDILSITIAHPAATGQLAPVAGGPAAAGGQTSAAAGGHGAGLPSASGLTMSVQPTRVASGSIQVVLGDGSQLGAKLTALQTLLVQADLSGVTEIDLTVPDRPAALTAR